MWRTQITPGAKEPGLEVLMSAVQRLFSNLFRVAASCLQITTIMIDLVENITKVMGPRKGNLREGMRRPVDPSGFAT